MARLIDADKLRNMISWYDHHECVEISVERVCGDIDNAPTVDAVEVVRCKDCKKSMVNPFMTENPNMVCTRLWNNYVVEPDDFCSYGERRTDV